MADISSKVSLPKHTPPPHPAKDTRLLCSHILPLFSYNLWPTWGQVLLFTYLDVPWCLKKCMWHERMDKQPGRDLLMALPRTTNHMSLTVLWPADDWLCHRFLPRPRVIHPRWGSSDLVWPRQGCTCAQGPEGGDSPLLGRVPAVLNSEAEFMVGSFFPKLNVELMASNDTVISSYPRVCSVWIFSPFIFSTLKSDQCRISPAILPFH